MKRVVVNVCGYACMTGFYLFCACVGYMWWRGA